MILLLRGPVSFESWLTIFLGNCLVEKIVKDFKDLNSHLPEMSSKKLSSYAVSITIALIAVAGVAYFLNEVEVEVL